MSQYENFKKLRLMVPAANESAYFDTAATGLIPDFVYEGVSRYLYRRYHNVIDEGWKCDSNIGYGFTEMIDWSKTNLSRMINCNKDNIFFGSNSSQLFSIITSSIDLNPGDNVILPDNGWMSNRFAWQMREIDGVELRFAKTEKGVLLPETVFELCDDKTKAVSLSYVESSTGFRCDTRKIGEFCRKHGIWFVLDGVQALGVLNIDAAKENIDYLVGNDYKWMMNFSGIGFAYISNKLMKTLNSKQVGWMSDDERFNTNKWHISLRSDAGKYETGYPNVSGIYGLGLVAANYNQLGDKAIEDYVLDLTEYLYEKVRHCDVLQLIYDYPREQRSTLIYLRILDDTITNEFLMEKGVFTQIKEKNGCRYTRISIHYYNNKTDIDKLIEAFEGELK